MLESGRPVAGDGASINEAATCITCAIGIDYLLVCILCVCVCVWCVCVWCVCVWCVCVCVCVCVSILASRGSDQLMVCMYLNSDANSLHSR